MKTLTSVRPFGLATVLAAVSLAFGPVAGRADSPAFLFGHLAGSLGGPGSADGSGTAARFWRPGAVATDRAGNTYVADTGNDTVRLITAAGVVTTLAGRAGFSGSADGQGSAARFNRPGGIAVDAAGNVYVGDTGNNTVRRISPNGTVTTLAGAPGVQGRADGAGSAASFNSPASIAVDGAGNLFVVDVWNRKIRQINPAGEVSTLPISPLGEDDLGYGPSAGLAVDRAGNLYVADTTTLGASSSSAPGYVEFASVIRKITPAGDDTVMPGIAGQNTNAGLLPPATFPAFSAVAADLDGNLWVVAGGFGGDTADGAVLRIAADGTATIVPGTQGITGTSVAVDAAGALVIADSVAHTITRVAPSGPVSTLAGMAASAGSAEGTGTAASFCQPNGLAVDPTGNVYVTDFYGTTIRKITPAGTVTTLAGVAGLYGNSDGTGTAARFALAGALATDAKGNIYVADRHGETLRKITPDGVVTTNGEIPPTHGVIELAGLAVDDAGNIYFGDSYNSVITVLTPQGDMLTVAGSSGSSGYVDGPASVARFGWESIRGLAIDQDGNLFVAEDKMVRKVTPQGVVTTLAGTPTNIGHADGTGGAARFTNLTGVAVDPTGDVYVTDDGAIRRITPEGVVTTIGGIGGVSGSADGIGTEAQFNEPAGIAVDRRGSVFIADTLNQAIRVGMSVGPPVISAQPLSQAVAPGTSVEFAVTVASNLPLTYQWRFNGSAIAGATGKALDLAGVSAADTGTYTVVVANLLGTETSNPATLTVSAPASSPTGSGSAAGSSGGGAFGVRWALACLALLAGTALQPRRLGPARACFAPAHPREDQ